MTHLAPPQEMTAKPLDSAFRDPQLGAMFDHAPIGVVIVSADRRFRRANPQACAFLGYTEEELKQFTFLDITHPDDLSLGVERTRELLEGKHDTLRFNKRYIHKNGKTLWADVVINTVRREDGTPEYFISQIIDISSQREAEEALRASEQRYRSLVEEQTDMVCRYLPDTTLTYVKDLGCQFSDLRERPRLCCHRSNPSQRRPGVLY